jgi:hypothetical protein
MRCWSELGLLATTGFRSSKLAQFEWLPSLLIERSGSAAGRAAERPLQNRMFGGPARFSY